jgi:O-antigen ligase
MDTKIFSKNINKFYPEIVFLFIISFIAGTFFVNAFTIFFFLYFVFFYKKILNQYKNITIAIILFFLITLVNTAHYGSSTSSLLFKAIFFLRILILPVVLAFLISNKENIDLNNRLFKYLFYFTIVIAVDIIFQYILGFNLLGFSSQNSGLRNPSFFNSHMVSGSFLSKLFPLITAYVILNKYTELKKNILFKSSIIIIFLAIIFSGERMAFINAVFFLLVFSIFYIKKTYKYIIAIAFIFFFNVTFLTKFQDRYINDTKAHLMGAESHKSLPEKIDLLKNYNKLSQGIHYQLFNSSIKITINSDKIFGYGIKGFQMECFKIQKNDNTYSCTTHPHNIYLEILNAGNIILLIAFLIFIILIIKANLRNYKNSIIRTALLINLLILLNPIQITGGYFSSWYGSLIMTMIAFSISNINDKNILVKNKS